MDTGLRVDVINVPITLGERKNIQAWRAGNPEDILTLVFKEVHK